MPKISLNKCKKGDVLISKHGKAFIYDKKERGHAFPHKIIDPLDKKAQYSRTTSGEVYRNYKMPEDHDIVMIIHVNQ